MSGQEKNTFVSGHLINPTQWPPTVIFFMILDHFANFVCRSGSGHLVPFQYILWPPLMSFRRFQWAPAWLLTFSIRWPPQPLLSFQEHLYARVVFKHNFFVQYLIAVVAVWPTTREGYYSTVSRSQVKKPVLPSIFFFKGDLKHRYFLVWPYTFFLLFENIRSLLL